jgi:hypothetical protein
VKTAILLKGIYRLSAIPNKFPLSFFIVIEKNILKFIMETQETLNSQSNPEQKEQCWRNHNICLQIILQSHSSNIRMGLAQNKTHMEKNRKLRNKPTHPEPK